MKKIISYMLVLFLVVSSIGMDVNATESDLSEIEELICVGESITDPSSAEAFVWIANVLKIIEKHTDSYVYDDIKTEATYAKGYSNISISNKQNIIIGYLYYLKDELSGKDDKNVEELLLEAQTITNYNSSANG